MIDLNPYVEEYASGENDWRGHSNGKSRVGFVVCVLHKMFVIVLHAVSFPQPNQVISPGWVCMFLEACQSQ